MRFWLLLMVACGGPSAASDDGGPPGNEGGGGGGDGGDGGSVTPANNGYVAVSSWNDASGTAPMVGGTASAGFYIVSQSSLCTEHVFGSCSLYVCPMSPPPPTYASAGTVTITGLSQPVTLTVKADNSYTGASATAQTLFNGGETIAISATGATVPAFSMSVTAPSRASITAPTKPASTGFTLDRTHDFQVAWSSAGAGKVHFYVVGTGGMISCGFDVAAGSGSIPSSLLTMLSPGSGSFSASSLSLKTVDKGDWRIYGQGFFSAVWPDQSICSTTITLQ